MILRYYGHSFFSLELANGKIIAFDPYGKLYSYPERKVKCDLGLVSHHHDDHDGIFCLDGSFQLIDKPGCYQPMEGVRVEGIETFHDEKKGALRGKNTIFIVEAENLRVVHCGDLGHILSPEQIRQIGKPDVLLLPVGGYYTINAQEAETVRALLSPTVTVPMHYRTEFNPEMPIQPLEVYLKAARIEAEKASFMRFTAQDIGERRPIVVIDIAK